MMKLHQISDHLFYQSRAIVAYTVHTTSSTTTTRDGPLAPVRGALEAALDYHRPDPLVHELNASASVLTIH